MTTKTPAYLGRKWKLEEATVIKARELFDHYDDDRSDAIDRGELHKLLRDCFTNNKAITDQVIKTFLNGQWKLIDKDQSGDIDFEEFLQIYKGLEEKFGPANKPGAASTSSSTSAPPAAVARASAPEDAALPPSGSGSSTTASAAAIKSSKKAFTRSLARRSGIRKKKTNKHKNRNATRAANKVKVNTIKAPLSSQNYVSNEILWQVVRNNHSFLVRRDGSQFSSEPGNLKNLHNYRFTGLAKTKTVDVSATKDGVTLTLASQKPSRIRRPKEGQYRLLYKQDPRPVTKRISRRVGRYRPELRTAALARAGRVTSTLEGGVVKKQPNRAASRRRRADK